MKSIILIVAAALLLWPALGSTDDDDDEAAPPAMQGPPALSAEQQQAVGVVLAHPQKAQLPQRIEAYGEVLGPAQLIADAGRADSSRAAARAAMTEAERIGKLYRGDGEASLKALEAAQAAHIEAQAQAQAAVAAFKLQWGPLARLDAAQRQALIEQLDGGEALLLRADVPGRLTLGPLPKTAQLDIDGVEVPARVLGSLPHGAAGLQGAALLLQADHAPPGLGPGARLAVSLEAAAQSGLLLPRGAILYGGDGPYVYKQLAAKAADGRMQYTMVPVKLLQSSAAGWLVQGVDDDDLIVAQGAGVLWSLQGIGGFSAAEDDHD